MGILEEIAACDPPLSQAWGGAVDPTLAKLTDGTSGCDAEEAKNRGYARVRRGLSQRKGRWRDLLVWRVLCVDAETDPERLRRELIYVAKVCLDWIEALDRRMGRG